MPYLNDSTNNNPLSYAIKRKSYECSTALIEFIINTSSNIYTKMVEQEIIDLINFSPNNLKDFFNKALVDDIVGVPGYGTLRKTPISYAPSEAT